MSGIKSVASVPLIMQQFVAAFVSFQKRGGVKSLTSLQTPNLKLQHTSKGLGSAAHMKEYSALCGFADAKSAGMPLTYPHMSVFPLQIMLMLDKCFPFSGIGLIHLSNRIQIFDALLRLATQSTLSQR